MSLTDNLVPAAEKLWRGSGMSVFDIPLRREFLVLSAMHFVFAAQSFIRLYIILAAYSLLHILAHSVFLMEGEELKAYSLFVHFNHHLSLSCIYRNCWTIYLK